MAKLNESPQSGKQTTEIISVQPNAASTALNQLLKVSADRATSARDLHNFLEIETRFDTWFGRMKEYGFTEGVDFVAIAQKRATAQGNETTYTDYALTLDTAKEISMIQRTPKGKQAREYFIACEKQLQSGVQGKAKDKLNPHLPFRQIEVGGKSLMAIVHPELGHLFTYQEVSRFLGCTEKAARSRKKSYKHLLVAGQDYHYFSVSASNFSALKHIYFTESGLRALKNTIFVIKPYVKQKGVKVLPQQPTLFTSQASDDNTIDLLMQIEDKAIRTGLFQNLKARGAL